jgi:hypothetical protein
MVDPPQEKGEDVFQRVILFGALALVAAALLAPGAAANKPLKEPLPTLEATGQFCEDFQVRIETTANKEVLHTFSSGAAIITGVLKVEVTNLETEETLALNISGPGKFSEDGSTLTGGGPWLLFGEEGELGPNSGAGMMLIHGRTTLRFGPAGLESIEVQGHTEDICAALS